MRRSFPAHAPAPGAGASRPTGRLDRSAARIPDLTFAGHDHQHGADLVGHLAEATRDLDVFYPTSLLITGFDILFFWVARMAMLGIKFMGDVPFRDVNVHSVIQAPDGTLLIETTIPSGVGINSVDWPQPQQLDSDMGKVLRIIGIGGGG